MAEATPDVEQLVSDYDDLLSGDLSKLNIISEAFSFHGPTTEFTGRSGLEESIRERKKAFPDMYSVTTDYLASPKGIMREYTWSGTHKQRLYATLPDGREVKITGMSKLIIKNGKIQECYTYYDSQDYFAQLGVTTSVNAKAKTLE